MAYRGVLKGLVVAAINYPRLYILLARLFNTFEQRARTTRTFYGMTGMAKIAMQLLAC